MPEQAGAATTRDDDPREARTLGWLVRREGGVKALWEVPLSAETAAWAWLGQAGFAVRFGRHRLLIDPYLSDHLARKYHGTEFPHVRLTPAPIEAGEIRGLDLVLCSHRDGDHMDPGTLPLLAQTNPQCRIVVPRAEHESALRIGLPPSQLFLANDGDRIALGEELEVRVIPSAHETLQTNSRGEHRFLGYLVRLGKTTLYHGGDTLAYQGLAERLRKAGVDLALLPVNGRREWLSSHGIAGNMTFDEAVELCHRAGVSTMMPYHWGMFAFNTADPVELARGIERLDPDRLRCMLPDVSAYYVAAGRA